MKNRTSTYLPVGLAVLLLGGGGVDAAPAEIQDIKGFVSTYCGKCHGHKQPKAELDLVKLAAESDRTGNFESWERVMEAVNATSMPPEDEAQPTPAHRQWLEKWFASNVLAKIVARPGKFAPRRLSAHEYRNTLRSLFGFDLEVAIIEAEQTVVEKSLVLKLLPVDPPGPSGFTNDTSANPLTTNTWDQYSYLVDTGLEKLFSKPQRGALESIAGKWAQGKPNRQQAEAILLHFLPRIFRRPLTKDQKSSLQSKLSAADDLQDVLKIELKAALMSPAFIYRGFLMPRSKGIQNVDNFEIAERLSYFLWGDMPDSELMELAASAKLTDDKVLTAQANRMLASHKSRYLAEVFAVQWLGLDDIDAVSNNPPLAVALKSQPLDFMDYLFRDGRPLIELIDSKTAFISPLTAGFYPRDRQQLKAYRKPKGIEIEIVPNQRIELKNTSERGGILTMPGVLAMNKGPVIRGTWMLERVLGEHLPDPPPDVGQVPPNPPGKQLTFRERFEMHRSKATCAVCHDKIDPLGFSLQAYDGRGAFRSSAPRRFRKKRNKSQNESKSVDTSGRLPSGETFQNFAELKQILVTSKRDQIIGHIVDRTLSHALARKLTVFDKPELDRMTRKLSKENGTFHDLVREIVTSLPFRKTLVEAP